MPANISRVDGVEPMPSRRGSAGTVLFFSFLASRNLFGESGLFFGQVFSFMCVWGYFCFFVLGFQFNCVESLHFSLASSCFWFYLCGKTRAQHVAVFGEQNADP